MSGEGPSDGQAAGRKRPLIQPSLPARGNAMPFHGLSCDELQERCRLLTPRYRYNQLSRSGRQQTSSERHQIRPGMLADQPEGVHCKEKQKNTIKADRSDKVMLTAAT